MRLYTARYDDHREMCEDKLQRDYKHVQDSLKFLEGKCYSNTITNDEYDLMKWLQTEETNFELELHSRGLFQSDIFDW